MSSTPQIDLSQLPPPAVVEVLSYESILVEMLADLRSRDEVFDALVESDPAYKVLEVAAFREVNLRQRVNDAAKSVMLAFAAGSNLDQLGALFGVERLVLDAGDPEATPPIDPTYEVDADFKRRIQLSLESLSVAGPVGAYLFHALSVVGVKDVSVENPTPGVVLISVLSSDGDGTADAELIAAVAEVLNDEDVRPLSDTVNVQTATLVHYIVDAELEIASGPDSSAVLANAQASVEDFVSKSHMMARDVNLSALYAALHVEGVLKVTLNAPGADVVTVASEAPYCAGITIVEEGS